MNSQQKLSVRVFVAILCGYERTNWLCPALVDWLLSDHAPPEIEATTSLVCNYWPVDYARNVAVERALNNGADWLVMVDNDMGPNKKVFGAIASAHKKGLDVVGFAYPILTNYGLCPSVLAGQVSGKNDDPEFEEVPAFGSGLIAIRTTVFRRLERPFFKLGIDNTAEGVSLAQAHGEDMAFCKKASASGLKLNIARGIGVDHFKTIPLLSVFGKQLESDQKKR